jgi:hypothetical protein
MKPAIHILAGCFATYGPATKAMQCWIRDHGDREGPTRTPSDDRNILVTVDFDVRRSDAMASPSPEAPYDAVFGDRASSGTDGETM